MTPPDRLAVAFAFISLFLTNVSLVFTLLSDF
ncbi:hypothetical protein BvCmsKSP026_00564 [Escherichia coli]|nr:hypothetical protein BvCmsKKP062_04990 [Escherichia coli]GDJ56784.1 hypothetical protein BvCmsKSP009_04226 [Escherichia coli]GDJ98285.1 hypothetical protein BvCmsKSP026_00564 [Escherichia coli]GDK59456.1 hypothetical protein BvCmsKSP001_01416 [Escherichia coli]GDL21327.1 hypothetical protein BvCmsKSP002_04409 [Escherichia coli]